MKQRNFHLSCGQPHTTIKLLPSFWYYPVSYGTSLSNSLPHLEQWLLASTFSFSCLLHFLQSALQSVITSVYSPFLQSYPKLALTYVQLSYDFSNSTNAMPTRWPFLWPFLLQECYVNCVRFLVSLNMQYYRYLHCVPTWSDKISSHSSQQPRVLHQCDMDTFCFTAGSKHLLLHCYWQLWVRKESAQYFVTFNGMLHNVVSPRGASSMSRVSTGYYIVWKSIYGINVHASLAI